MPNSITLSNLSWSTPDGHSLFNGLSLTLGPVPLRTGLRGESLLVPLPETPPAREHGS